jgi:hypothetical protein
LPGEDPRREMGGRRHRLSQIVPSRVLLRGQPIPAEHSLTGESCLQSFTPRSTLKQPNEPENFVQQGLGRLLDLTDNNLSFRHTTLRASYYSRSTPSGTPFFPSSGPPAGRNRGYAPAYKGRFPGFHARCKEKGICRTGAKGALPCTPPRPVIEFQRSHGQKRPLDSRPRPPRHARGRRGARPTDPRLSAAVGHLRPRQVNRITCRIERTHAQISVSFQPLAAHSQVKSEWARIERIWPASGIRSISAAFKARQSSSRAFSRSPEWPRAR